MDHARAEHEAAELEAIIARLIKQFPNVGADHVEASVRTHYETFAASRIRDFVPMLVERATRDDLRSMSNAPPGTPR
jgi:hypothetical protein